MEFKKKTIACISLSRCRNNILPIYASTFVTSVSFIVFCISLHVTEMMPIYYPGKWL
jgi:hypothetical protein